MSDTDICYCGHVRDEHGGDPAYPGSSACTVADCDCGCFEHDPEAHALDCDLRSE